MNINISHICLANAFRDEMNPDYRYGKRHEKFLEFMKFLNSSDKKPHVVSIKELRKCKDLLGEKDMDPNDIINQFAVFGKYAVADCQPVKVHDTNGMTYYNPMYLGQLYDNTRLYKMESKMVYYYQEMYDSPEAAPHMGGSYLYVKYAVRHQNGIPDFSNTFSVGTIHFPLPEQHKLITAKYFNKEETNVPDIIIGDFNFFKDDVLFPQIYNELTNKFIDVVTGNLKDQNGVQMFGTFYPFPHDKTPIPIVVPYSNKKEGVVGEPSHLDYVFLSKTSNMKYVDCMVLTNTFNPNNLTEVWSFDNTTFPLSDHLPMFVELELASK